MRTISEPTAAPRSAPAPPPPAPGRRSSPRVVAESIDVATWLRRSLIALASLAGVLLVTGLYLTVRYRPAATVHGSGVPQRSWLVGLAQTVHGLAGYLFVIVVVVVVGLAIA